MVLHVNSLKAMCSSETCEWATSQDVFDQLDAEFHFTLDVCATADNAKCACYFTDEMDGLLHDWFGVCWMNPPYGRRIGRWIKKAYESSLEGTTVVCLLPSRTDTAWWHDYVMRGEVRFVRGRLYFVRRDGKKSRGLFPSVIVVFRPPAG